MSSTSTRCIYGAWVGTNSDCGPTGAAAPMIDGVIGGGAVSKLDDATTRGYQLILKIAGNSGQFRVNGAFNLAAWKSNVDDVFNAGLTNAIVNAKLVSGNLVANCMCDDLKDNSSIFPNGSPTLFDFEAMAQYSKAYWPNLPCILRVENQYLKSICSGSRTSYLYLDGGMAQWHEKHGAVLTWWTNHVNQGKSVGLGAWLGINLLCGGSGITAPWNVSPNRAGQYLMSPQEINAATNAAVSLKKKHGGCTVWAEGSQSDHLDSYHLASIQAALTTMADTLKVMYRGPVNPRSDPVVTPPTDVEGHWSFGGTGRYRTGAAASVNAPMPATVNNNDLLGLVVYSRDSGRSSLLPTGWSTAKSITGFATRGGTLALYYKLANGTEGGTNQVVTFDGAGTDAAEQCISFVFSGNTTSSQAAMLANTGSAHSWAVGSSNMGPVPGLVSSKQDALIVCVAAKTNDFNNSDPVVNETMSDTTTDGEAWSRMILSTNGSGSDSGVLIDYALTKGFASITSKSWTQLVGSASASSGAGCGFMVAFTPVLVPVGVAPAIIDFVDVQITVGDTLAFTMGADGTAPITWAKTGGPASATVNATTGAFSYLATTAGTFTVSATATNTYGTDTDSFIITVVTGGSVIPNQPPVVTNPGNMQVAVNEVVSFGVAASDPDGDPLSYDLVNEPAGATINASTGQFLWTPGTAGAYTMSIAVSDGTDTTSVSFTITVVAPTTPGESGDIWTHPIADPIARFRRL